VYFAVDEYTEVEFIIANAYLSYMFSEHVIISGLQEYREYCRLCRENLEKALSRLPLLLPASMEVIAALTIGVRPPCKIKDQGYLLTLADRHLTL
jgi:hypothetical protein